MPPSPPWKTERPSLFARRRPAPTVGQPPRRWCSPSSPRPSPSLPEANGPSAPLPMGGTLDEHASAADPGTPTSGPVQAARALHALPCTPGS